MADNNPFPGENNTGHIWDDDLRELENPPPSWWMLSFWASLAGLVIYSVLYPAWPFAGERGYSEGILGWTQMQEYNAGVDEITAKRAVFEDKIAGMSASAVLADPDLAVYAEASSKVLFGDNCAPCHGGGGQGGPGFPVLADDDWLYGGAIENIEQTVTMGRNGIMTAHGKILTEGEIGRLAQAVVAGNPAAEPLFLEKGCIACHGMDGKGMAALGSANLTDSIWRFDEVDRLASVTYTITHGVNDVTDPNTRQAQMPTFGGRLSGDDIKKLAVFVHKLGGGQ